MTHTSAHTRARRGRSEITASIGPGGIVYGGRDTRLNSDVTELTAFDPRQARIVELRYFGGLSKQEVAEVLAVSRSTVTLEWQAARARLFRRITGGKPREQP